MHMIDVCRIHLEFGRCMTRNMCRDQKLEHIRVSEGCIVLRNLVGFDSEL